MTLAMLFALLFSTPDEARTLASTAPAYLTIDAAAENYAAARIAATLTGERPELLLAIAWHESRYDRTAVSQEPGNRVSCGVMTPEPLPRCPAHPTLLQGYMDGAQHLAVWRKTFHDDTKVLWAYAGGGGQVARCEAGSDARACRFAGEMLARAKWIARRPGT